MLALFGIPLLLYGTACAWLFLGQRQLIFLPSRIMESTPQEAGISYEDVWISIGDDTVHGWWLPGHGEGSLTFLYLHGNAENISQNLTWAIPLQSLGASVFMIDYRGYGLSSGPFPRERQLYDDAVAALNYLQQKRGIAANNIVIYGHSLGGAVGVQLASQFPQLAGLIVESSFTSMTAMAERSSYADWFPVRSLLIQKFDSLSKVSSLNLPVFYIHGAEDASVPPGMSQQLYRATPEPKELWLVPGADHNDVIEVAGQDFQRRIHQFLADHMLIQH